MTVAAGAQITILVLLEVNGIDHDGLLRLRRRIDEQRDLLAVRRPGIAGDVAIGFCQLARLAATAILQHDLALLRTRGSREKCERAAVGTPSRLRRAAGRR